MPAHLRIKTSRALRDGGKGSAGEFSKMLGCPGANPTGPDSGGNKEGDKKLSLLSKQVDKATSRASDLVLLMPSFCS
jgi:hypothetical protein